MGMKGSINSQLFFKNLEVPAENRIGEEGLGFTYQMVQFQEERMYAALGSLTGMQKTIDETIAYTRDIQDMRELAARAHAALETVEYEFGLTDVGRDEPAASVGVVTLPAVCWSCSTKTPVLA